MSYTRLLFWFALFFPALSQAQEYEFETYETFDGFAEKHLEDLNPDTTYVINFWATWCGPCVKELPYFEALHAMSAEPTRSSPIGGASSKASPIKVTLVTIDLPMAYENSLLPFLERNNLHAEVVGLMDGDANAWIDRIDPRWSGAIPITLFIKNGKTHFHEKAYHSLEELVADLP